LNDEEMAEIR